MTEEYYPGSKRKRKEYDDNGSKGNPVDGQSESEDRLEVSGRDYTVGGSVTRLYPVGELALALNRKPVTVRKMEQEGVIPKAPLILPSHDQRGQRRLYTRQHIEGLKRIAAEEGVLLPNANGKWKSIEETQFREKALKLFKELST